MPNIIIDVAGEAPGVPGVAREFAYSKIDPTPPLVSLSVDDVSGITQWDWSILDQPYGASAVLTTPGASTTDFTPTLAIPGTYLLQCSFNGGASYARCAVAWDTKNLAFRFPAAGEETEYGIDKGWSLALRKVVETIDTGLTGGGERLPAVKAIVDCTVAPPTEVEGDRYILDASGAPHVDWDGAAQNDVVEFNGSTWDVATTPVEGQKAYVDDVNLDALFQDDPALGWVYVPLSPWTDGGGTSSLKRSDNAAGTASGGYAINAGWGGAASADYSFQGGRDNIITANSVHSVAVGGGDAGSSLHSVIGTTVKSPQSFIMGENNRIDGNASNQLGFNFGLGKDLDIDGDFNGVFGRLHSLVGNSCFVTGYNNDIGSGSVLDNLAVFGSNHVIGGSVSSSGCIVAGDSQIVEGLRNAVFGSDSDIAGSGNLVGGAFITVAGSVNCVGGAAIDITGSYVLAGGQGHTIDDDWSVVGGKSHTLNSGSYYSAIFGDSNGLGGSYGSPYSLVAGKSNIVDGHVTNQLGRNCVVGQNCFVGGDYDAVFGLAELVHSDYSIVSGNSHDLKVGSDYCAIFGYDHTIGNTNPSTHSLIAGDANGVDGLTGAGLHGRNCVVGNGFTVAADFCAVFGEVGVVGGAWNLVSGNNNAVYANGSIISGISNSVGLTPGTLYIGLAVFGEQHAVGQVSTTDYGIIAGNNNTVDGHYDSVFGYSQIVAADYGLVAGYDHDVAGDYCVVGGRLNDVSQGYNGVFGYSHVVDSEYCGVFGYNHTIGGSLLSPFSLIAGSDNTVDGSSGEEGGNCVVGKNLNVDGDYDAVFGYGHSVASRYDLVGGINNSIYAASEYLAVFGELNVIGAIKHSLHSLVAGKSNAVDGNATNELGFNCVVGDTCDIDADYCGIFGKSLVVRSDFCLVAGDTNSVGVTVDAPNCLVTGNSHVVDGWYYTGQYFGGHVVTGMDNDVLGAGDCVFGSYCDVGLPYNAVYSVVMGRSHVLGSNAFTMYSVTGGFTHVVDGSYHAVFGNTQTVSGSGHAVFGALNTVGTGNYSLVSGYDNDDTGGLNIIGGQLNVVSGSISLVCGDSNNVSAVANIVGGYLHDVDSVRNVVGGYGNYLDVNSSHCGVFGYNNDFAARNSSPFSLVGGQNCSINGTASNFGCNCVVGNAIVNDGDYNAIFGDTHDIDCSYSLVSGSDSDVDGTYCGVFGESHTVAGQHSVVGGFTQTLAASSTCCGVFGHTNNIGATKASPYSLIAGEANTVDGNTTNQYGYNCVVGDTCDVDGDYCGAFGKGHTVASDTSSCFGESNSIGVTVDSPGSFVSGYSNTVNGWFYMSTYWGWNSVFGAENNITGAGCVVLGRLNTFSATYSPAYTVAMGRSHVVGSRSATAYCVVGGYLNTVDGNHNVVYGNIHDVSGNTCAVFGNDNTVVGTANFVCGSTNDVSNNYNLVGGATNYVTSLSCGVFGEQHDVAGNYSVVGGYYNNVTSGLYGAIFGYQNEIDESNTFVYGRGAKANWYGQMAFSGFAPSTSAPGESQNNMFSASCECLGDPATWTQLYPDGHGGSKTILMEADGSYYFHFAVVARKKGQGATELTKSWYGRIMAQRDSGGSNLVGTPTVTPDFATSNGDEASWDFRITVDGSHNIVFEGLGSVDASDPTYFQLYVWGPNVGTAN